MKKFLKSRYAPLSLIALQFIIILFMYSSLPDDLPMQFNGSGEVNWSMPKIFGAWTMPGLSMFIVLMGISKPDASLGKTWFSSILMFVISIGFYMFILLR